MRPIALSPLSFPRKRESRGERARQSPSLDSRFRGNDIADKRKPDTLDRRRVCLRLNCVAVARDDDSETSPHTPENRRSRFAGRNRRAGADFFAAPDSVESAVRRWTAGSADVCALGNSCWSRKGCAFDRNAIIDGASCAHCGTARPVHLRLSKRGASPSRRSGSLSSRRRYASASRACTST